MDLKLTVEEEKIIKRVERLGEWDHLIYEFSLLVPSFVIIGIGTWNSSPMLVLAGAIIYCFFRILITIRQGRSTIQLRSAIEKLKKQSVAPDRVKTL